MKSQLQNAQYARLVELHLFVITRHAIFSLPEKITLTIALYEESLRISWRRNYRWHCRTWAGYGA